MLLNIYPYPLVPPRACEVFPLHFIYFLLWGETDESFRTRGHGSHETAWWPPLQIVLCEDKEMSQKMVNHTLAHELIHAFDQCRIKINWDNCLHHACSEVRAPSAPVSMTVG